MELLLTYIDFFNIQHKTNREPRLLTYHSFQEPQFNAIWEKMFQRGMYMSSKTLKMQELLRRGHKT